VTVGFHSPLPPARTGVADYAASLLRALRQHGDVRADAELADVHLYHIGNNQLHRAIYARALENPGVAVLHDAVLQHLFLGGLTEEAYVEEFVYNYGEWHRDRARMLWRDRAASATDDRYFRYAMVKRIAATSRAVVVHNGGAAEMVRSHAPDARIVVIPHLFDSPPEPDPLALINFRRALGIPLDAFVFGVFGYLRESKRVLQALEVFAQLRSAESRAAMLIAGEFVSSDLERACGPLLETPGVYRAPYLAESAFWTAASSIDACINLRVPAAGETSGIAIRMMGLGKALLLTDGPENADYPQGAYLPVPRGVAERAALFDYICILSRDRVLSDEIGRMASGHVRREHSLPRVSELYWNLLCESAESLPSA
jgi:glycosyltransferase involved in cell wall biosynthesis